MNKRNALVVAFITGSMLIAGAVLTIGWSETWSALVVPTMYPPFADLRTVQGAIFSSAQGFDPQLINPEDPWKRPMNYPSVWVTIAQLFSLNLESNYLFFICTYILIYLSVLFCMLRRYKSLWLLITIFSGSSLLAVERGNNDLIVFIFLYFSTLTPILLSGVLIVCASVLKIYPIFSLVSLYCNKKVLLLMLVLVGFYLITQIPELRMVCITPVAALPAFLDGGLGAIRSPGWPPGQGAQQRPTPKMLAAPWVCESLVPHLRYCGCCDAEHRAVSQSFAPRLRIGPNLRKRGSQRLCRPSLNKIRSGIPITRFLSYGVPIIVEIINSKLKLLISGWIVALGISLFALIVGTSKRIITCTRGDINYSSEFRLFLIGASVYLGTFIASSNFDYRLIFLIFCIPFIEKIEKNNVKIPLLISIVLASNQMILITLLGPTIGWILCLMSKMIVFVTLIWLVQNNISTVINFVPFLDRLKKSH